MKKILFFAIIIGNILYSSCSKLLDEDIRNQISSQYYQTPQGAEDGVKACYSYLRNWYGKQYPGWLTVYSDEFTNGAGDLATNGYTTNLNASNVVIRNPWNEMFEAINTCNAVIEAITQVEGMDEPLRRTREAEAHFLRAHYYYLLVQTYGELPLSLEPTAGVIRKVVRTPIADIYNAIIEDLIYAVENLPATTADYGRVTLPAAKHGLAKVYLTRAGTAAAQSTDYANAAKLAIEVITNAAASNLVLLDDFADIFAQGAGTKNQEVIWACQYSTNILAGGLSDGSGNQAHLFFTTPYDSRPGMQRSLEYGRPYSHYQPTTYMLDLFDKQHDSRFDKSFRTVWLCNKPGTYTISGKSVNMSMGDTAIVFIDYEPSQAQRNAADYTIFSPSQFDQNTYPQSSKFEDGLRADINNVNGVKDFIIFRLGETYLIAAEALMMQGKVDEAVGYINVLRRRAAIVGESPEITEANRKAMEITAADLEIDFILDERSRELSGEYMRWFDLVRTGKLVERIKRYNEIGAPNIKDYHVLRPIPQTQIDRVEGGNAAFPQNPGYN